MECLPEVGLFTSIDYVEANLIVAADLAWLPGVALPRAVMPALRDWGQLDTAVAVTVRGAAAVTHQEPSFRIIGGLRSPS